MAGQQQLAHTHRSLCELAVEWLRRPSSRKGPGCVVAVSETQNGISSEIPDAIGWRPYRSGGCGATVVEVKVSRADFLADAGKPHRKSPEAGMGAYRYYMAPVGVISESDLPPRWGLIEVTERGNIMVRCGHVLLSNYHREKRVGDPQKFQDMLREAGNRAGRLEKEAAKLRERVRELESERRELRRSIGAF